MTRDFTQPANGHDRPREADGLIGVLIVDEAILTRDCLVKFLQNAVPEFVVTAVGHCQDVQVGACVPDVVVLNGKTRSFPDRELSAEAANIMAMWPGVPRLIISEKPAPPATGLDVIRRGWQGYFPAEDGTKLLIAAIRLIALGGVFIPARTVDFCVSRMSRSGQ